MGLILQHRQHLAVATVCLLLCTASNLAAPVLSGLLFETLVQQQPMTRYAKVRVVGVPCSGMQRSEPTCSEPCYHAEQRAAMQHSSPGQFVGGDPVQGCLTLIHSRTRKLGSSCQDRSDRQ